MNNDSVNEAYHGRGVDQATQSLTRNRINWVLDHLPAGRIIDVGCSQGTVPLLAAQRGDEVLGLDLDETAITYATARRAELPVDVARRLDFQVGDGQTLTGVADQSFDAAAATEVLTQVSDPGALLTQLFRVLKPGGTLVVTVPYGMLDQQDHHRTFYRAALRRLLEPLFEIHELTVLERHVAAVGSRRAEPLGEPRYALDSEERAFLARERQLTEDLHGTRAKLDSANAAYRRATGQNDDFKQRLAESTAAARELRVKLDAANAAYRAATQRAGETRATMTASLESEREQVTELRAELRLMRIEATRLKQQIQTLRRTIQDHRAQIERIRKSRAWRLITGYRRILHPRERAKVLSAPAPRQETPRPETPPNAEVAPNPAPNPVKAPVAKPAEAVAVPMEVVEAQFREWLDAARAADGDEVILMFSGTTFVQEHRGNRPIRLTNVYLKRHCPVFFNYYRWHATDPLPEHPDVLLFQSPIDITPSLLDELLRADFGGKRKLLFASFPHDLMVRNLVTAAQHGWVTIYDARDDWEEFAKVGMAKWYHPGHERYIAAHADIVTAVSRPLARKMSAIAASREVHVVANALDTAFPEPPRPRRPADRPVIGYFGHLTDKWFDWQLIIDTAERYPDYVLELAGHQEPKLNLPANVRLLGMVGHQELAERSLTWGLAVIPFKNGPLADAVDPIKVYEYLHLGLPVLATYFPQCRDYPGVTVTESAEEFLALVPRLLGTEPDTERIARWLQDNTWERRVETYSRLSHHTEAKGRTGLMALLDGTR
ncbi:hypothetical protein GCM10009555_040320 [Acrocarpospora macrocephala]|uniref:Methyltransferase type 11 domain-containing protein n=1 Tax=Acrocarpospora macrocephala TaxID=150177 RepID=A0A5M3WL57_9ACTN|nr:methyltransferase domain-containing protein [Acrocarpospora macrocephala]GES09995.1 hypothetical protein Amac_035910 [Acrocarpospora macrocephala]